MVALVVLAGVATSASVSVQAGYVKADRLRDCVGYSEEDLRAAPEGNELPFGGVRVFSRDGQRGRSKTFCLTITWDGARGCCSDSVQFALPDWLRRNAESLRLVVSPECSVWASLSDRRFRKHFGPRTLYSAPARAQKPTWKRVEIPERQDDLMYWLTMGVGCWDGVI
jgi:hypothetical protein